MEANVTVRRTMDEQEGLSAPPLWAQRPPSPRKGGRRDWLQIPDPSSRDSTPPSVKWGSTLASRSPCPPLVGERRPPRVPGLRGDGATAPLQAFSEGAV